MSADAIYQSLNVLGQDGLLSLVQLSLIIFFVLGFISKRFRQVAPTLMTSVGIAGTFCGIFLALYPVEFTDRETMDASVRTLLEGMKTAFVTSLLGIASAIVFRIVSTFFPASASLGEMLRRFARIEPQMPQEQREVLERLDAIKQAIAGEGDSSMVTQLQKMRDENRDGIKQMDAIRESIGGESESSVTSQMQKLRDENREGFKQMEGLSETIREALVKNLENLTEEIRDIIGKQLGESLKGLINSIEKALIEQFGKTFVEFNEATQALKKWQEEHREHVEKLTAAFNMAAERITEIAAECEKIPPTMERLQEVVETAHGNVESLNRQVEAFAAMRQQAEESFPVIKTHLDKIGEDLSSSAKSFEGLEETITGAFQNVEQESRKAAEQHAQSMQEMSDNMREALSAIESDTREVARLHGQNVNEIVDTMITTLTDAQNKSAKKITDIVESALAHFSKQMNDEIDRVTELWGGNLVSIAQEAQRLIKEVRGNRE